MGTFPLHRTHPAPDRRLLLGVRPSGHSTLTVPSRDTNSPASLGEAAPSRRQTAQHIYDMTCTAQQCRSWEAILSTCTQPPAPQPLPHAPRSSWEPDAAFIHSATTSTGSNLTFPVRATVCHVLVRITADCTGGGRQVSM